MTWTTISSYRLYAGRAQLNDSALWVLQPSGGSYPIGPERNLGYDGMAIDPITNIIYVVSHIGSYDPAQLYTVNPATGGVNILGPLTGPDGVGGFGDISFDANGQLYGLANREADHEGLWTIDKTDATCTWIGNPDGVNPGGSGLSFDADGVLWGFPNSGEMGIFDKDTGAFTYVADTKVNGVGFSRTVGAASWHPTDRAMYVAPASFLTDRIYTVDLGTGALTLIQTYPNKVTPSGTGPDPIGAIAWAYMPQYTRIYGWTLNISDDAVETVDPLLLSPQVS